jgi:HEAT repeat protein
VVPGSQYYNRESDSEVGEEIPLCGAAGTVTIVHYDLWHRRSEKTGHGQRFMFKFLFTRMEEPDSPAWDSDDLRWPETDDRRAPMWRAMWEWSAGGNGDGSHGNGGDTGELAARLSDANETTCFQAAYSLAAMGAHAVPELISLLSSEDEDLRRNAGYGLAAVGPAAVPALEEAAGAERPEIRAAAVDVLGDMGLPAAPAIATLRAALKDEDDQVSTRAAYALGNVGDAATAAIPSLVDALDDPEDWVARHSLLALARLGPRAAEAVPRITRYLHHDNRYVRSKAALVLRRAGTQEATDALIEHLSTARWCPLTTKESQY